MGYYSEISLTIYEKDYLELLKRAKEQDQDILTFITKWCNRTYKDNGIVTIYWNSVKWYEGYKDVDFVENFMRSGIPYSFRRVGESYDDVEEENGNDDDCCLQEITYVERYIEITSGEELDVDEYLNNINSDNDNCNEDDKEFEDISKDELLNIIGS